MSFAIVDLSAVMHTCKHSAKRWSDPRHIQSAIVYGVLQQLRTIHKNTGCERLIFALDSRTSVRKEAYPDYKHGRKENLTDFDLACYKTFDYIKQMLLDLGYRNVISIEGFEADDVIAQLVRYDQVTHFCTHDNDMYQCLASADMYWLGKVKTGQWFMNEYGIYPNQWGMVKAIAGCKSDQVEGISRVGEKTAIKYIRGTDSQNAHRKIDDNWETVERNIPLVTLPHPNCPEITLDDAEEQLDPYVFHKILVDHNIQSILKQEGSWLDDLGFRK